MASKGSSRFASGTAIVIAPYLAITARHVIEDLLQRYDRGCPEEGHVEATFSLQAFQVTNRDAGSLWSITRLWLSPHTDIAFVRLTPASDSVQTHTWRGPKLRLTPPKKGERAVGFGYHSSEISASESSTDVTIVWKDKPTTTVGEVLEVHDQLRDRSRLRFPCFRTNARFDGGMSGGPIFNEAGELCGLICSSLPPSEEAGEHTSYAASLWPAMGTILDMDREGYPSGSSYPALELARAGIIKAGGWERVVLNRDQSGFVTQIGLSAPR